MKTPHIHQITKARSLGGCVVQRADMSMELIVVIFISGKCPECQGGAKGLDKAT